jgi:hypothetical protein
MPASIRTAPAKAQSRPTVPTVDRRLNRLLASSDKFDNVAHLRLQRLRIVGIIGARAACLAELAWGGGSNV